MKVVILDNLYEDDIDQMINKMYIAARTCYSPDTTCDLIANADDVKREDKISLIQKVLDSGHHSICEHVNITFCIEGISRSASHQLVRHRLCTYSQQSQRYCSFEGRMFDYITPPTIKENEALSKEYHLIMEQLQNFYDRAVNAGIKGEDARYILPNAACTNITVTTNLRNLIHIMGLRCCTRAQWEIRAVFKKLAEELKVYLPFMAKFFAENCVQLGYCPEGRCCGKSLSKKQMLEALAQYKNNQQS